MIGDYCVVRTYSAGVHCGIVKECNGTAVLLHEATRLWNWSGAFSLSEVAMHGVGEDSRISEMVPRILLTQAIEVIPCTAQAEANLRRTRNN